MRRLLLVVLVVMTGACASNRPDATDKATAGDSVGVLFTVDGVTVYRFGDGGRYHYFAVRTGRPDTVTLSAWSESCGKNCTRQFVEEIPLIAER